VKLMPFLSSISGSNLELPYVTSDDFSASAEHNPRKPQQQSDENQGEPQVRRDVVHRLASPFIWQEQGKIDKKPKRQRPQQGEKHAQHDRHNEVSRVHCQCCDALLRNTTAKSLSH